MAVCGDRSFLVRLLCSFCLYQRQRDDPSPEGAFCPRVPICRGGGVGTQDHPMDTLAFIPNFHYRFLDHFSERASSGTHRQSPLFKMFLKKLVDEITKAIISMSQSKIGALIAIEREVGLKSYVESGIALDGMLTTELLLTIFMPNTPFHDGGAIIQGERVMAVGCLFPLSQSQKLSKTLGTRHRAALGLSEETDALVIVVSEETGVISLMSQGKVTRDIDEGSLRQHLIELYQPKKPSENKGHKINFLRKSGS